MGTTGVNVLSDQDIAHFVEGVLKQDHTDVRRKVDAIIQVVNKASKSPDLDSKRVAERLLVALGMPADTISFAIRYGFGGLFSNAPPLKPLVVKFGEMHEANGDKGFLTEYSSAASWYTFAGEGARAAAAYTKEAEGWLKGGMEDTNVRLASDALKRAGNLQRANALLLGLATKYLRQGDTIEAAQYAAQAGEQRLASAYAKLPRTYDSHPIGGD